MGSVFAGVGVSELQETSQAVAASISAALAPLDHAGVKPSLAMVFSTSRHDGAAIMECVRNILGPHVMVIGGSAVGIITRSYLGYDGWQLGVALLGGTGLNFTVVSSPGLANREAEVGRALGVQLSSTGFDAHDAMLLFYDTVKTINGKPALNLATPLLSGMAETLGGSGLPQRLAGMGTIGDMQLHPTVQFVGDAARSDTAVCVMVREPLRMDTVIMHGCRPAGRYYEITRTDGPVVLEIDGKPALDVIGEMLGPEAGLSWEDYAFFVTLGLNRGDPFGPYKEENYANRMCIGVDVARKGLVMFENDLVAGMKVQLMRRSVETTYIAQRVNDLLALASGRELVFAFYIDCAGRAAAYCGADEEEAVEVQKSLPQGLPLLGVYSGVEIARVAGHAQALDWTGVLCLFSVQPLVAAGHV